MITKNNLTLGSLVAIGMTTLLVTPTKAEDYGYGPFQGFKKTVAPPPEIQKLTAKATGTITNIPFDGKLPFTITESQEFQINEEIPIIALVYIELSSSMSAKFNKKTSTIKPSVVWALDLDAVLLKTSSSLAASSPIVPPNSVTGFDPDDPEIEPIGGGVFIDCMGMLYPTTTTTVTLANLSTIFPALSGFGYDLSAFTGDPDSVVYVSQVEVLASNFACTPEPSAFLGLLTLGLLGSSSIYKRKR